MKQNTTFGLLAAGAGAVAVGAAIGATTGSVSASILLALAMLLLLIVVFNTATGRVTPRDALLSVGTGVLPPVVFFLCTALGLGGTASFDTDSQWVGALAGGTMLIVALLARSLATGRGSQSQEKPQQRA